MGSDFKTIPLIDIGPLVEKVDDSDMSRDGDLLDVVRMLDAACKEAGFFYVKGHGIAESMMMEVRDVTRMFFQLPLEEKQKIRLTPQTGYRLEGTVQKSCEKLDHCPNMWMRIFELLLPLTIKRCLHIARMLKNCLVEWNVSVHAPQSFQQLPSLPYIRCLLLRVELRCYRGACGVLPGENRQRRQVREGGLRGASGQESSQQLRPVTSGVQSFSELSAMMGHHRTLSWTNSRIHGVVCGYGDLPF